MQKTINWEEFAQVQLCVGTVLSAEDFPAARKPAYRLTIDFGPYGTKRSSAQLTELYKKEELVGRQVVAVLNLPPKQIANFFSEALTCGFADVNGAVVLAVPDKQVGNGAKLF